MARRYWLFKSEPDVFSIHDLEAAESRTTGWDGVRNYQARNFLRDDVQVGDGVLFHHSNADPPAIVGTARVVRAGHPDPTAFDPAHPHFDPKSRPDTPTWYQVAIRLDAIFPEPVTLPRLKATSGLAGMELLRKGSRLSIQPVTPAEWRVVLGLAGVNERPARAGRG